jgi:hypothetical protein
VNPQIEALCKKLNHPLVAEIRDLDVAGAVAAIVKELDASFTRYKKLLGDKSITAINFYWAGAEIEPFIPSDVMGNVYAGRTLLLDSTGGFTPIPLPALHAAEAFDDDALTELFMAASIELAKRAVAVAVEREPFRAMTTARPFQITATPGHDVPRLTLLAL